LKPQQVIQRIKRLAL